MEEKFNVELLPDAVDFLNKLEEKARDKMYYNIRKSQFTTSNDLLKKLNNNIWEFRTLYNQQIYRLFAFWDKTGDQQTLIIATHGIIKKTQKTPSKEIDRAENLRRQYFNLK